MYGLSEEPMDIAKLTASIKLHEGTGPVENGRFLPYTDSTGHSTIGYGINLDNGITQDEANYLLQSRLSGCVQTAQEQPWWPYVQDNDARSRAFTEVGWNIGFAALLEFHDAINAASRGDWAACGAAFLDSLWARQVKGRAEVLAAMIITGQDPA